MRGKFHDEIRALASTWFLLIAALLFIAPLFITLVRDVWTLEQGSQGPIILISGLVLLAFEARKIECASGDARIAAAMLVPALLATLVSRIMGTLWLEWLSGYGALLAIGYAYIGSAAMRRLWFPLAYLLFLTPPPYALTSAATRSLKIWISNDSIDFLSALGFDVARSGTMLYIDQYELLMADACGGLNSIFSLFAIGMLYIYLIRRTRAFYAALLAMFVIPVAILANFSRVLIMLLSTRWFGDAFTQHFVHSAAGFLMFAIALFALMLIDGALTPFRDRAVAR